MSEDTRPSRWLTALAAFGGFWLIAIVGALIGIAADIDRKTMRDFTIPLGFLTAFIIYSEARFKKP